MTLTGTTFRVMALASWGILAADITAALGQCEVTRLTATDAEPGDRFGTGVSISGDLLIVGSWLDDGACPADPNCNSGSAYVFRRTGTNWLQEAKLTASDASFDAHFGVTVAIDGGLVVVGAANADGEMPNSGAAYVFTRRPLGWIQEAKLTSSNGMPGDQFGAAVSISGDTVLIGAEEADSAYIFQGVGTRQIREVQLIPTLPTKHSSFGRAVSIDGDIAMVGAPSFTKVYVFRRDGATWVEEDALVPMAPSGAYFGGFRALANSGSLAIVGSPRESGGCQGDPNCFQSGAVYSYRRQGTSWVVDAEITASNAVTGGSFGKSVSLDGNVAAVWGRIPNNAGTLDAVVYVLLRNDNGTPGDLTDDFWVEQAQLSPSDAADFKGLAPKLSVSRGLVLVGSAGTSLNSLGEAFVFGVAGDCNANSTVDACEILGNPLLDSDFNGTLDACQNKVPIPTVSAWGLMAMALLMVVMGVGVLARRGRLA